jgi:DNA replication protein DnaC
MKNPFATFDGYKDACLSKIDFDDGDSARICNWLEKPRNLLYIYSDPGVGKTYLAAAITNMFLDQKKYCWYMSEQEFFNKLRSCVTDGGSYSEKIKMMSENHFLILDDLGSTRGDEDQKQWLTPWQKEVHFAFLDNRVMSGLPTVITSNYSPHDLKNIFHERYISRILSNKNTIIKLKGSDKRQEGL